MGMCFFISLPQKRAQLCPGSHLVGAGEVLPLWPCVQHVQRLLPFDGTRHLFHQQLRDRRRFVVAMTRHVRVDRDDWVADVDMLQRLLQGFLGRLHEGRMERPTHRQILHATYAKVFRVLLDELKRLKKSVMNSVVLPWLPKLPLGHCDLK